MQTRALESREARLKPMVGPPCWAAMLGPVFRKEYIRPIMTAFMVGVTICASLLFMAQMQTTYYVNTDIGYTSSQPSKITSTKTFNDHRTHCSIASILISIFIDLFRELDSNKQRFKFTFHSPVMRSCQKSVASS